VPWIVGGWKIGQGILEDFEAGGAERFGNVVMGREGSRIFVLASRITLERQEKSRGIGHNRYCLSILA
jgi:hypothetical protein